MKQPSGVPQRKQFIMKPGMPLDRDAEHNLPPPGLPRTKQFMPKPNLSAKQSSVADQDTAIQSAVYGSLPAGTPWPNQHAHKLVDQASMTNQSTAPLASLYGFRPVAAPDNATDNQRGFIRRMLLAGLTRLQEPQPEGLLTRGLQVIKPEIRLGMAPVLALTNGFGLLLVSIAYYISILGYSYPIVEACYFSGLLIMVIPNLVRLLSRKPERLERICLLCVLAGCSYFVQFMSSPLHFSAYDEFLHWRTADDILRTGHIFSENSMLPASPYFPGLEILTNAVSTLTGLSTFYSGNIVIVASRLLMFLALFLFYEHITRSSRMASIAVMIYMANPHFIFFDAQYSYETLSLPFAVIMMYILARYERAGKNHRWVIGTAWIVLIAITITHHMTDYFFVGLLFLWMGVSFFRSFPRNTRIHLTSIATCGLFLSLMYAFLFPGNPVWSYLSGYFGSVFDQLEQIITGTSVARPLFASSLQPTPIWDRLLMTGSVVLITFLLPFGLLILQRLHRDNILAITFGIASLLYPLMQTFRFTSFGSEIPERAAAFLFLPIAYMLTISITHFWPTRKLNRRAISLITGLIVVILVGNVLVAAGPNLTIIPGPYLVVADSRSVETEGIEDAMWSQTYLGTDNRVATDRINQMLMNTYGHQHIVTHLGDNVDVAPIFYSEQFNSIDTGILREGDIHYLVVDTRLSTALPLERTYFESDRPTSIISRDALTKFKAVTQINRLFDSGNIVIYDTSLFNK